MGDRCIINVSIRVGIMHFLYLPCEVSSPVVWPLVRGVLPNLCNAKNSMGHATSCVGVVCSKDSAKLYIGGGVAMEQSCGDVELTSFFVMEQSYGDVAVELASFWRCWQNCAMKQITLGDGVAMEQSCRNVTMEQITSCCHA
jgi:hypothetical protein